MTTIQRKLSRCLTVAELKAELEGLPDDAPVLFLCDYGDICHTQQALPVQEVSEAEYPLVESAYSQSGIAYAEPQRDDRDEEEQVEQEAPKAIILR